MMISRLNFGLITFTLGLFAMLFGAGGAESARTAYDWYWAFFSIAVGIISMFVGVTSLREAD